MWSGVWTCSFQLRMEVCFPEGLCSMVHGKATAVRCTQIWISDTACRRKMGYPRTVFIDGLYILWTLQNWVQETDLATTYLLDITSERRNGPHSSLTGGIVWAGALSNCKTSIEVTKNIAVSSGIPRNFVWGGVQQMQLRTERMGIWGR